MSALRCQHRSPSILTPPIQCEADAVWLVFAAYSVIIPDGNPLALHYSDVMVHYPAPMVRTCSEHLHAVMLDDFGEPVSAREWLVRPIGWDAS